MDFFTKQCTIDKYGRKNTLFVKGLCGFANMLIFTSILNTIDTMLSLRLMIARLSITMPRLSSELSSDTSFYLPYAAYPRNQSPHLRYIVHIHMRFLSGTPPGGLH